jgi:hypothetical protein
MEHYLFNEGLFKGAYSRLGFPKKEKGLGLLWGYFLQITFT